MDLAHKLYVAGLIVSLISFIVFLALAIKFDGKTRKWCIGGTIISGGIILAVLLAGTTYQSKYTGAGGPEEEIVYGKLPGMNTNQDKERQNLMAEALEHPPLPEPNTNLNTSNGPLPTPTVDYEKHELPSTAGLRNNERYNMRAFVNDVHHNENDGFLPHPESSEDPDYLEQMLARSEASANLNRNNRNNQTSTVHPSTAVAASKKSFFGSIFN